MIKCYIKLGYYSSVDDILYNIFYDIIVSYRCIIIICYIYVYG